jgi:heme-degrading monooxygenase HmoA
MKQATVVRIWRTGIDPDRESEYEAFARTRSLPMFRAHRGFVGVLFARRGAERIVVTLWDSAANARALAQSPAYGATVAEITATGFLRGKQSLEVLDLEAFFSTDR